MIGMMTLRSLCVKFSHGCSQLLFSGAPFCSLLLKIKFNTLETLNWILAGSEWNGTLGIAVPLSFQFDMLSPALIGTLFAGP